MHSADIEWLLTALFVAPEPAMILAMTIAYLANAAMAYQRFNRLAVAVDGGEFLPATRAWTTKLRYHVSALAYLSVCLFLFRVLQLYPELIGAMADGPPPLPAVVAAVFGDTLPGRHWIAPLLITGLVYLLFRPGTGVALGLERRLRRPLQRASSIPRSVRSLLGVIQDAAIVPSAGVELGGPEGSDSELLALLRQPDGSVEALWARAHYLDGIVESWARSASEFNEFWHRHQAGLLQLRQALEEVQLGVERFRTARAAGEEQAASGGEQSAVAERLQTWLEEEERSATEKLHQLLDRLHITLSCAQLATFGSLREGHAQLGRYGLQVEARAPRHDTVTGISGLMEDTALLLVALLIVVYPLAVVAASALGWQPASAVYRVWFVWPLTLSALVAAALWPAFLARQWAEQRSVAARRWLPSLLAAALAYLAGVLALAAIAVLDCSWDSACNLTWHEVVSRAGAGGMLSAGVAMGLGLALQNSSDSLHTRLGESLLVGLLTVAAGLAAYAMRVPGGSLQALLQDTTAGTLLVACAVSGLALGYLIPHAFRRHAREVLGEVGRTPAMPLGSFSIA